MRTFLKCGKMVKIVCLRTSIVVTERKEKKRKERKKEELFEKSSGRETKRERERERERERDVFRATGTRRYPRDDDDDAFALYE